jgi:hypothetical protein
VASIATPVFRQIVDDTYMASIVDKLNRPPTVTVKRTSTLALTASTDTVITWQAEQGNDFDAMWDVSAATVLTIKTEGLYDIRGQVRNNSTVSDEWYLDVLLNGSTSAASIASNASYGVTNGAGVQIVAPPTLLAVNDVLRLLVRTSATGKALQTTRGGSWFSAQWRGYGT